ncbi:lactose-binding lectin l-2-like [Hippocampus comes]|uniref:Lactose-binding lectin l-2-like n=1 Tax=Hippocampus comes TaxID=109280 RepID=A0A3Q2Z063_HIPCM|nr:PREDICTED: lactose-binding lectin l-2-like [Hippocampus comes]
MALTLRSFLLLCVISGAVTGAWNRCPEGWVELEHRCYIYQSQEMTFLGAEKVCNILGGNLVSIHNSLENAVVFDLIQSGPTAWIGLHSAILDQDFLWTDGSIVTFTAFNSDGPDGLGNCVQFSRLDGFWQDHPCDVRAPFVCIQDVKSFGDF